MEEHSYNKFQEGFGLTYLNDIDVGERIPEEKTLLGEIT